MVVSRNRTLSPEDFQRLFSCESEEEYRQKAPSWLWHVRPPPPPQQNSNDDNSSTAENIDINNNNNDDIQIMLRDWQKAVTLQEKCAVTLQNAGLDLPQDIPYREAKAKITEISSMLQSTVDGDEYNRLCLELETYSNALLASDEYQTELQAQEQAWEDHCKSDNIMALKALRRHVPTNVRLLSETQLVEQCKLPKPLARKLQRTNILQLVRIDPAQLEKMHPSLLENYKTTGLTLTERRALYAHLEPLGAKWRKRASNDPAVERKYTWWNSLRNKLKEMLAVYEKHQSEYGNDDSSSMQMHKCNLIGMQCPFKANAVMSYDGDYGFPEENEYEHTEQAASSPVITFEPSSSSSSTAPPRAASGLLRQLAQPLQPNYSENTTGNNNSTNGNVGSNSQLKEVQPKKVSGNLLQAIKQPQSLNVSNHGNETKRTHLKEVSLIPSTIPEHGPNDKSAERESSKSSTDKDTALKSDTKEMPKKKEISPQERISQTRAAVVAHFKDRPKQLNDALDSIEQMDQIMDQIDADLNLWVERMIDCEGHELSDEDQNDDMNEYNDLIKSFTVTIDDLTERAKWVARSEIECLMAEDLYTFGKIIFNFILGQMREYNKKDKKLKNGMKGLKEKLNLIHDRNMRTLKKFKVDDPESTRPILTIHDRLEQSIKARRKKKKKKKSKSKSSSDSNKQSNRKEESVEEEFYNAIEPSNNVSNENAADTHKDGSDGHNETKTDKQIVPQDVVSVSDSRTDASMDVDDESTVVILPADVENRVHLKWQLARQLDEAIKVSRRYESAVKNAGLSLPEDGISYQEAEQQIAEISQRMNSLGYSHPEYFKLEQQMQKYTTALMASSEYKNELKKREQEWEEKNKNANMDALKALWRHMPVNLRQMSEENLVNNETPNGKHLPKNIVRKFKRTNSLQLLRVKPSDIEKMHFADLEGLSLSGATLTELRALYQHLKQTGAQWEKSKGNNQIERKYMWFVMVRDKMKQTAQKWDSHVLECGPPNVHKGCSLKGNMCPFTANMAVDYSDDYGYPDHAEYEVIEVTKEDLERYMDWQRE